MLPDGWSDISLGDAFSFKNGLNGNKELYGAGTKFVNVMDVFRGPRLRVSEIVGSMKISPKQLSAYAVQYGDVLLNRTSETRDEIALATVYLDTAPAVFGGFVIRARPTNDDTLPEFCVYGFQSAAMRRAMIRLGQGAIRSNIGQGDLSKVKWRLPPLPEQRRIAEILSTWDCAIETVEALIANARAQKKALMQNLLTAKKRLPGFSEDWDKLRIGVLTDLFTGGTPSTAKPEYWGGSISWMSSGEINLREIHAVEGRITERGLEESSAKMIPVNSVLIALAGQGKTRGKVAISRIPLCTNQSVATIVPNQKLSPDYLFHNLDSRYDELRSLSLGDGGRGGLNLSVLRSIQVPVPEIDEQIAIASILRSADEQVELLESKRAGLCQEKSALMQQLLTGKRRVKVDEREVA